MKKVKNFVDVDIVNVVEESFGIDIFFYNFFKLIISILVVQPTHFDNIVKKERVRRALQFGNLLHQKFKFILKQILS